SEEIPVRTSQERAEDDEQDPKNQKPKQECCNFPSPLFKSEIAVSFWVCINVRNGHQFNDDQTWKHDSCQPRIEVDEDFLQSEEIPRGFRGIWRTGWVRRIFQRRLQCHRPTDQDYS